MERYVFGELNEVRKEFPRYDYDHARKSLDGSQAVIVVDIDDAKAAELTEKGLQVMEHEAALQEVSGSDWSEPAVEVTEEGTEE